MKVLLINGSPRRNGNTAIALEEMEKIFTHDVIYKGWITPPKITS